MAVTDASARPRGQLRTGRRALVVGLLVAAAVGFLVYRGLDSATLYFRTADEAVAERDKLGTRRFRIEGAVVAGSVRQRGEGVGFDIAENGVEVAVLHKGDPPELFKPDIPVVLEGRWDGKVFASDRIMVKHTEEYKAENPDRVSDYSGSR